MNNIYNEQRGAKKLEKIVERIETPESGGFFVYHKSFDYPEKGYRNNYILNVVNIAKKALITWIRFIGSKHLIPVFIVFGFLPWKSKIKIIENWLSEYTIFAYSIMRTYEHEYFLKPRYFSPLTHQLIFLIKIFLISLGVSEQIAFNASFYLVVLIEYDTAYYYRILDLLSETNAEKLSDNPRQEILRLIRLAIKREHHQQIVPKFESLARIGTLIFLLPKVKKAFRHALKGVEFEKMQYDEDDRKYVRNSSGYDYFGMTYEERKAKWPLEIHELMEVDYDKFTDEQLDRQFLL